MGFIVIVVGFYISQPHVQPTSIQHVGVQIPERPSGDNGNTPPGGAAEETGKPIVELAKPKPEVLSVSDKINTALEATTNEPSVRRGIHASTFSPPLPFAYSLKLYEGTEESDGAIDLGQEIRAVANTNNSGLANVSFKWMNSDGDVLDPLVVPIVAGSSANTFKPDAVGAWTVVADFGNGNTAQKQFDVKLFVVPESQLGVIVLIGSSLAALAYFYHKRMRSTKGQENAKDLLGFGLE